MRWLPVMLFVLTSGASLQAESPAVLLPTDQPGINLVGTAFGPQPNPCWGETHEPLYPRGPQIERWKATAEYLLWQLRPGELPVPFVTSTTAAIPLVTPNVGALGQPDTVLLGGNRDLPWGTANGLRMNFSYLLQPEAGLAVELNGFGFERRRDIQLFDSGEDGDPLLAVSFHRVNPGLEQESRFVVAFPGIFAGQVYYDGSTQLWGAELNLAWNNTAGSQAPFAWRFDLLGGLRYLGLNETLSLGAHSTTLAAGFNTTFGFEEVNDVGVVVGYQERFETENRFWGPQLGGRAEYGFGRFFLAGTAKVALGITQQIFDVDGYSFLIRQPGAAVETLPGAFFASPTNSGRSVRNEFSVVPEVGLNFGWHLNECTRVAVGYTFLYWSNVARPGDQLDRGLNTSYLPLAEFYGQSAQPLRPALPRRQTDFWAHGVNFSLEVEF